jgi:hypothetical protein
MHYFLHIVTDAERIIDPEGQAFADLAAAGEEASQNARDLMAEELRCGRPVPWGWRVQIADQSGAIVQVIRFASLLFEGHKSMRPGADGLVHDATLIARAKAIFARVRKSQSELNVTVTQLKAQLRTLAEFNAAIGHSVGKGALGTGKAGYASGRARHRGPRQE